MTNTFEGTDSAGSDLEQPKLQAIANLCAAGSCPTIYRLPDSDAGSDSVVVQGFIVQAQQSGIDVPDGEALVKIPVALLTEAMRHLS